MREAFLRYRVLPTLSLLLAALFLSTACDNGDIPTDPSDPPLVTDTFSGTVTRNGSQLHTFVAGARGTVTATITAITPAGSPAVGFTLGSWDPTFEICTAVLTNNLATVSSVLSGGIVGPTSLCVRIFDSTGTIPADAPVDYTVTVERPE